MHFKMMLIIFGVIQCKHNIKCVRLNYLLTNKECKKKNLYSKKGLEFGYPYKNRLQNKSHRSLTHENVKLKHGKDRFCFLCMLYFRTNHEKQNKANLGLPRRIKP